MGDETRSLTIGNERRRDDRERSFRAYVQDHRTALVRTATLLTSGDGHLAEDLVQVTLTRLYVAWPRLQSGRSPHAYAHRVLTNAFIDETRRPRRRRERSHDQVPEPLDSVAQPVSSSEDRELLLQALARLAPKTRAAIVLRHWLQFDVAETATVLGCSQGTVKSQTARGLQQLRDFLGPRTDIAVASDSG